MVVFSSKKSVQLLNSLLLAFSVVSCSTNQINTSGLNNSSNIISKFTNEKNVINSGISSKKLFGVKYASGFNAMAYFLTYQDIRDSIKNKTIPDAFYHHFYSQVSEPNRLTNPTYLQVKNRLESGEFSEEAYLLANPDVKSAVDAGTIPTGYQHWYSYASTNETTRKTKQEYVDAKAAIDAGFNEKAYRLAWTDIDNLVKNNAIPNAYTHYHTWAKNNETTRVTDARYVKIKNAVLEGYDENAYLLAYPDVKAQVTSGFFPKGIDHYINFGLNEGRLERDIYQDAKLAIVNDFSETRYRTAFPDVNNGINLFWFPSAFEHFRRYGRYEGRITRASYIDAKYVKSGSEFIINSYTTGAQNVSAISADSNGNFVVTWAGPGTGDTDGGVFAQRYNSSGVAQGSNFLVNSYVTGTQNAPAIKSNSNGDFIITWSGSGTGDTSGVFAQRYNSSGVAQGSNLLVNSFSIGIQSNPSISSDSNGNFVISWHGQGTGDSGSYGVFAQRYNSSGVKQGSEFLVNSYTTGNQFFPSISSDQFGNFVISWHGTGLGESGSYGIYAQRYNSSGAAQGSNFLVNSYVTGNQRNSSVSSDSNGNFVITWHGAGLGENGSYGIYAQRYNSSGVAQGSDFLVNSYTTGNQVNSKIASDSNGNFVITWYGIGTGDNASYGIFTQRYNSSGVAQSSNFLVNSYTTGNQSNPSIAVDSIGNFVITWQGSATQDTDGGVFAQRYSSQ